MKQKILFVCTSNMTRSSACEDMFKHSEIYEAKSAGTSPNAIKQVNQDLIDWADIVVVMCERTDKHLTFLNENFMLEGKSVHDLDLEDFIYSRKDDPALLADLRKRLAKFLTLPPLLG